MVRPQTAYSVPEIIWATSLTKVRLSGECSMHCCLPISRQTLKTILVGQFLERSKIVPNTPAAFVPTAQVLTNETTCVVHSDNHITYVNSTLRFPSMIRIYWIPFGVWLWTYVISTLKRFDFQGWFIFFWDGTGPKGVRPGKDRIFCLFSAFPLFSHQYLLIIGF